MKRRIGDKLLCRNSGLPRIYIAFFYYPLLKLLCIYMDEFLLSYDDVNHKLDIYKLDVTHVCKCLFSGILLISSDMS